MEPISQLEGTMLPMNRTDVDTDQIIPRQFLNRVEKSGFGEFVFFEWRRDPDFEMNDPRYARAEVLVAGRNFGSGSSRECAPWGLKEYGFKAIVAPSFSDIFLGNCRQVGLLNAVVDEEVSQQIIALGQSDPSMRIRIDLPSQRIFAGDIEAPFEIDPIVKDMLLQGLDDVEIMRSHENVIFAYENQRPAWRPNTANRIRRQRIPALNIRPI